MFAVLRFQKLKSRGEIGAMMSHWQRTKPTPNADPRRGVEPLLGSCQEGDVTWLLPKKYRSNAVLAVEGVLSASPQYFRPDDPARAGHYDPARTAAWVASSMTWLKAEFGDRLVSAILHLDEATPHIHCAVVPVTPKGTLCAREMFNPSALRRMQTNYGEALAPLGIKRGRESSTADHIEVGRYYHRVSKATEPLPQVSAAELATMQLFGRVPASIAELQARAIDGVQARAEVEQLRTDAAKPAQAAESTKQERQDLQNRLRAIPLTEVLPRLGYVRDPKARQGDWRGPAGRLTLADAVDGKPETFRLHDLAESGRGAIDLVMKTEGITFQAAVGWLCAERTTQEAVATAAACAEAAAEEAVKQVVAQGGPKMVSLSLDPEHVAVVSGYLVHERSLPEELIQPLIADQSIQAAPAAGGFVNTAFWLYPGEKVGLAANRVGVRLQSTQASYVYRGIRGERGVWNFTDPGAQPGGREVVVIGQGPISVLSVCALMRKQQGILPPLEAEDIGDVVFVATEGAAKEQVRKVVRAAHARGSEVVTAFDPDASGRSLERVVYEEAKVMKVRVARISDLVVLAGQHLTGFADLWILLLQEGASTLRERIEKGRNLRRQGHGIQGLGPVPGSSEPNF